MIERKTRQIAPAIARNRNLTIEDLKNLGLPMIFQGDLVIIERSICNDWKLKTPVAVKLERVLEVGEKGLVDYIIRSCIREQPGLIPYIFENKTLVKVARHLLRDNCSGSYSTCRNYAAAIKKYAKWLGDGTPEGYTPDQIIADIKNEETIPDPIRIQNHCNFLKDYVADLQDAHLKPGAVSNCLKAVKTFYRVNGAKKVELDSPISRKATNEDDAPTPENLEKMLDKADAREGFIITAFASGGFREGTLAKLKYRHVKEDLEAGIIPIHVHVEAEITKGKYHSYDTFLNAECCQLLKLYLDERRKGSRYTPPEKITDESPLIRSIHNAHKVLPISEKQIRTIVHTITVEADIAKKIPDSWMYNIRTHSIRKYFKTQLLAAKIKEEIIEYMMGHTISTYTKVKNLGIAALRNMYIIANLLIRPRAKVNRIDQLKEIIRAWGENPEAILSQDALLRGNITETADQCQTHQLSILAEELKNILRREVKS